MEQVPPGNDYFNYLYYPEFTGYTNNDAGRAQMISDYGERTPLSGTDSNIQFHDLKIQNCTFNGDRFSPRKPGYFQSVQKVHYDFMPLSSMMI